MLLPITRAVDLALASVAPLSTEWIPLEEAYGRVLADPITSPLAVPAVDNSSMDGFAVRVADLPAPGWLTIQGTIAAGASGSEPLRAGHAFKIMTGAPIPPGAGAVVKVEDTETVDDQVHILAVPTEGQFIRLAGEDIQAGQVVLQPGTPLPPAAVGVMASLGMPAVPVIRKPRVAILVTGDEVVRPGWPRQAGQLYSSNHLTLRGLALQSGAIPRDMGAVPDDPQAMRDLLLGGLDADIIITTGGVSMGEFDFVRQVLVAEGMREQFWRVAMRPGRPTSYGTWRGRHFFGLPGNPVSCMVAFLQFVHPMIRRMLGDPRPHLPVIQVELAESIQKRSQRAWLERVVLTRADDGRWLARRTGNPSSGVLSSMVQAHALLLLPAESTGLQAGATARVQVLDWRFLAGAEPAYGW